MTLFPSNRQMLLLNVRFGDVEQLCETVSTWDLDFRPLSGKDRLGNVALIQQFSLDGIEHAYARINAVIHQSGAPPPGMLTFTILGANLDQLWWRGQHVDAGNVLVFPRNSELSSLSGKDFETNVISVSDDLLAAICDCHELPLPTTSILGEVFRPSPPVLARLRQQIHDLRTGNKPASQSDYFPVIEQLVVEWNLVTGRAVSGNTRGLRNRDRAMRVCLDIISGSDLAEINPAALCNMAGVSTRTLEYAFKERFNISPAAFLKSLRMVAVRKELIGNQPRAQSVGDLAAFFGFWHSGQFARDYRKLFGETPSQTLGSYGPERAADRASAMRARTSSGSTASAPRTARSSARTPCS